MGTFNSFGQKKACGNKSIPVWLGVVSPKPIGGVLASGYAKAGAFYPAGTPICINEKSIVPLCGYIVVGYTTSDSNSIIAVKALNGVEGAPKTADVLMKLGSTFGATGKAWKPASVSASATTGADFDITVATSGIDVVAAGDILVYSSATAAGSAKSMANQPNAYLYNDIRIDGIIGGEEYVEGSVAATGAAVDFHADGILIDNTPAALVKGQMKSAVPNVAQIAY